MAIQDFLASYTVKIDEAGLNRLDQILMSNEQRANAVASAFKSAYDSVAAYLGLNPGSGPSVGGSFSFGESNERTRQSTELIGILSDIRHDLGFFSSFDFDGGTWAPESDDNEVRIDAGKVRNIGERAGNKIQLTADTSKITQAAQSALSTVRGMFAGASLTLTAKVQIDTSALNGASNFISGLNLPKSSTGGRFTSRSFTEVAEDGDPEYIIPIRKESIALPLLRNALSELSASARASLFASGLGSRSDGSSIEPGASYRSVQAPVNIYVNSTGSPEEAGSAVFAAAERFLADVIRPVMA